MGFNFSGVAVSKVSKNDITTIEAILGNKLTFAKEIYFENAMSYHKEDKEYDIYFGENGVLIFTSEPIVIRGIREKSKNRMITEFGSSETSMAFMVSSSMNGENFREFMDYNGDRMTDKGNKFENEVETDDGLYIVTKAISHTVGENFWGIEPNAKAFRYIVG